MSTDPKWFNNTEYIDNSPTTEADFSGEATSLNYYNDGSQFLANKGLVISFQHVPSETSVFFKAFITAFNETYSSDWAAESVYGRADPIYMFKQTQRKITLAFKIPGGTESEAYENLAKTQTLLQFLYPSYSEQDLSATTITQSPLIRLKVMNLLSRTGEDGGTGTSTNAEYSSYKTNNEAKYGLLGVINNITVNHNLENGDIGVIEKGDGNGNFDALLPKLIEINLDFSPIHESPLGWNESESFSNELFPYGALSRKVEKAGEEGRGKTAAFSKADIAWGAGTNITGPGQPGGFGWAHTESVALGPDLSAYDWPQLNQEDGGDQDEGYTPEQQMANAEARYAGLFGAGRLRRDQRREAKGKTSDYVNSAIEGAAKLEMEGSNRVETEIYDLGYRGDSKNV